MNAISLRSIQVPRLLEIRAGACQLLPELLRQHFDSRVVLVVTGHARSRCFAEPVAADLEDGGSVVELVADVEGTQRHADQLLRQIVALRPSLVVAIGGGHPIDAAKLAAARAGLPMVSAPTTLAHDGMSSPVVSLTMADGTRRSLGARMPAGVVIDVDVVQLAPLNLVRAGVGDLVSNITAVRDWRLAEAAGKTGYDEFAASVALQSALPVLHLTWPLDPDGVADVARGLVMSGLAMEIAGSSRPCSGAEHLISHALDELLGPEARPHGEQVALGALIASVLHRSSHAEIRSLFARIGFGSTAEGWGIDESILARAIQLAPTMRPDRFTILDTADLSVPAITRLLEAVFGPVAA